MDDGKDRPATANSSPSPRDSSIKNGLLSLRLPKYPFIAFEGPIASGKTTHATLLAERLGCKPLLEPFGGNEFLGDFYANRERWALPMQLSFLGLRGSQLRSVTEPPTQPVIADYSYLKDPTFAQLLLTGRELRLYEQIAAAFQITLPKHDLIVYLDARNDVLLDRIQRRNRPYEETIDSRYQDKLRGAYEAAFRANPDLKVVRYDTSSLDLDSFADVGKLQERILSEIRPD